MFGFYSIALEMVVWCLLLPSRLLSVLLGRTRWERVTQQMGWSLPPLPHPGRPLVVVHAVSAGEVAAAEPVIRRLIELRPGLEVLLTAGNRAGLAAAGALQTQISGVNAVALLPWDRRLVMRRWLDALAPQALVVIETELWPNLFEACSRRGIPLAIVNGRIYARDVGRYRLIRPFMRRVLADVRWIGVQENEELQRFLSIGAPANRIEVVGNAKADREFEVLSPGVASTPGLLVAGSTHDPEERWLLLCFSRLRARYPHLRLVLAPRDCQRGRSLEQQARESGFRTELWSDGGWKGGAWDVLVINAIGQLRPFYAIADVAVMGGSLIDRGGHNILEPAVLGRAIVVGPHMSHFQGVTERFLARDALIQAVGLQALEATFCRLMDAPGLRRELGARASVCAEAERGASERYARAVLELMAGKEKPERKP